MKLIEFVKDIKNYRKAKDQEMQLRSMAVGMNSSVDVTRDIHIVMLDFDVHDISVVQKSIVELQDFWGLSDADIYRTRNGHHVFFWYDHVPYERLKMIINYARNVDPMFKFISRYYDHKTMRASGKYAYKDIKFVCTVEGVRECSDYEYEVGKMKQAEHSMLL